MGIKFVDLNNKAKQVIGAWIQQEDHRKKRKP
jgi:hypothetical protein